MTPEQFILSGTASLLILFILFSLPAVYWWIKVSRVDSGIGFSRLISMTFRKIDKKQVLTAYMNAFKNNIDLNIDDAENHYLAGGDINGLVKALILAKQNSIDIVFNRAAAIDLAGRDVLEAVKEASITIDLKYPENDQTLEFKTNNKDQSIYLSFSLKMKLNLDRLIGGAGEEILLSNLDSFSREYMAKTDESFNPFDLRKKLLQSGIDANTRYQLIDIAIH